jgi:hypothetical protein
MAHYAKLAAFPVITARAHSSHRLSTSVEAPTVLRNDGILQYCGTSFSL